jgi:hypothetical protein
VLKNCGLTLNRDALLRLILKTRCVHLALHDGSGARTRRCVLPATGGVPWTRLFFWELQTVFLETSPLGKRLHGHTFRPGLWVACAKWQEQVGVVVVAAL